MEARGRVRHVGLRRKVNEQGSELVAAVDRGPSWRRNELVFAHCHTPFLWWRHAVGPSVAERGSGRSPGRTRRCGRRPAARALRPTGRPDRRVRRAGRGAGLHLYSTVAVRARRVHPDRGAAPGRARPPPRRTSHSHGPRPCGAAFSRCHRHGRAGRHTRQRGAHRRDRRRLHPCPSRTGAVDLP